MQLGLREQFVYELCGHCGSMQIETVPQNLEKYYPNKGYYSFSRAQQKRAISPVGKAKAKYLIHNKFNVLGAIMSLGYRMPGYYQWMKKSNTVFKDRILDVGTGGGNLLSQLRRIGFEQLTGIDPFIDEDIIESGVRILKKDLLQVSESYDLIMMHHSLEHMPNPLKILKKAYALLPKNGRLIVRIPIMGNYGWRTYCRDWSQLDAPRHLFIPSEKGMRMLAEQAGFSIFSFEYDTTDFSLWSSELYKKDIPLSEAKSHLKNPRPDVFTMQEIMNFRKIAAEINQANDGDIAAVYMNKS